MKKIIALILVLTLAFTAMSCSKQSDEDAAENGEIVSDAQDSGTEQTKEDIKHTGKKVKGKITDASVYSEGLAFVCTDDNQDLTYCIDKKGNIVFEVDENIASATGEIYSQFKNGYALVNGGVCDKKGKITYPEDVGATKFYDVAFEGGYIVAEKITADYSGSKKELGVMNMDFEWVVNPSESIYSAVERNLDLTGLLFSLSYYSDGFVYFEGSEKFLDLKTGEVSDTSTVKFPSEKWQPGFEAAFIDYNGNIMLDLSSHNNINVYAGSHFKNGKAPVKFQNREVNKNYLTLVNEKGEFLFEPVEAKNIADINKFYFDGENIVVVQGMLGADAIQCYNSKGELIGELNPKTLEENRSYSCDINDGVIVVHGGYNNIHDCYYFNPDFTPLF